jgi:hypothetical protein
MGVSILSEEWAVVRGLLPEGWEALARETGALQRARGVKDAETLLRLILLHAAGGLSMRQAVVRAKMAKLASISDVALHKRLRASVSWLSALSARMLVSEKRASREIRSLEGMRIRAIDASTVQEPGATGTSWRLHYCITLPTLTCDAFDVTGQDKAESFRWLPVRAGDVILADRGYCQRGGVAHVLRHGGHVVLRKTTTTFPLQDRAGRPFALLQQLRTLPKRAVKEWPVQFETAHGRVAARLCAVRKSPIAAARARRRARKIGIRKQLKTKPGTLEAAKYVFVVTTMPRDLATAAQVLELYRMRWQVELAFKRLKSLLGVGHVPKYDQASARAWIQAKVLTALMIEALMDRARFFSPWGFELTAAHSLA